MPPTRYVPIPGSERKPVPGAARLRPVDPKEPVQATVMLRARKRPKGAKRLERLIASGARLSRAQYEAQYGADPSDLKAVQKFARAHGLKASKVNRGARTLVLSGPAAAFSNAFQADLAHYGGPQGTYRGRTGHISIPAALKGVILGVHGLDNRPHARPHFRLASAAHVRPHAAAQSISYTPLQVAQCYDFPSGVNGQGETIAILELGGGYTQSDLKTYFSSLGISPAPSVTAVSVDGAENQPTGSTNGPDTEVMLDIEVAGAVAPAAKIVVYFAPNTDAGFLNAINQAVSDKQNNPSVISISWGGPESTYTAQSLQSYNTALQSAAAVGVSVCVAAGDNGSTDGETDGLQHVDFPASSPYALACGGTHMVASGGSISSESVWNDQPSDGATGGGVSATFPLPAWQSGAHVPPSVNPGSFAGRGLPDVAGDADPDTGYQVAVDGSNTVVGGTSAVAPLWAGLIARFNSGLKSPVGYLNPVLYQKLASSAGAFHDITSGNNGAYQAGPGWDACSGWGSPHGAAIFQALSTAPAGTTKAPTSSSPGKKKRKRR